jgi:hypothetical protein
MERVDRNGDPLQEYHSKPAKEIHAIMILYRLTFNHLLPKFFASSVKMKKVVQKPKHTPMSLLIAPIMKRK